MVQSLAPSKCLAVYQERGFVGAAPPSSEHRNGAFMLMLDGAVEFVSNDVSDAVFRSLGTRAGGEISNR